MRPAVRTAVRPDPITSEHMVDRPVKEVEEAACLCVSGVNCRLRHCVTTISLL